MKIQENKITRVELIERLEGRQKVIDYGNIQFSLQDKGKTLKIFYTESNRR